MEKKVQKIAFEQIAKLLIVASVLCVFFGNGVHVHAMFDHIFEHGNVHIFVHSHSGEQTQHHGHFKEFDDRDVHQHPTATVDLTATLTHKTVSKVSTNTDIFSSSGILSVRDISKTLIPLYLDLPPPELIYYVDYLSSYTTRGPPLG